LFKTGSPRAAETAHMTENVFTPALDSFAPTRFYDHHHHAAGDPA
jgi:hypothetical protein